MSDQIYVIILNYNGYSDTVECVSSLLKAIPSEKVNYQIVVVDNYSTDDSYKLLKNTLPENIILIESGRNNGYAYGNNIGIKYAVEQGAEYICILNNDTVITEDFLTPCIDELKKRNDIAFIGPMLMNYYDNLVQNTGGGVSIVKGKSYFLNKNVDDSSVTEGIIECDIVFGAAMLFKTELLDRIGLLPENYFLFYEETEWCYKAVKAGYKNCVNTKTRIQHKGSESLKNMNEMQKYLMERNRTLFVKRNGTPLQFFCFLFYDFGRTVYRAIFHGVPLFQYMMFHYDGIVEKYNSRITAVKSD